MSLFTVFALLAVMVVGVTSAQDQNIVEVAVGNEDFTTLVSLVQAAGLVDVLASPDFTWTVFAPTNDAFAKVPASVLEALGNDAALLTRVLTYHVTEGALDSATLLEQAAAESMEMEAVGEPTTGSQLSFTATEDGTLYVDGAKVVIADVAASNGVIHAIDRVLIPADIAAAVPSILGVDGDVSGLNIAEIAVSNENFSTLVSLVSAAGLVDVLASPDFTWTVFAPTNEAFANVPEEVLTALAADPALLTRVLTYHVVEGAVLSTDVIGMSEDMMAAAESMEMEAVGEPTMGSELTFTVLSNGAIRVDDARVLVADIAASNGVIHIIDSVLVPADIAAMFPEAMGMMDDEMMDDMDDDMAMMGDQTITEIAAGNPDFSTLVELVVAADLADVLNSNDYTFTVFAPTNAAFAAIPAEVVNTLLADKSLLTRVLTYHVTFEAYSSEELTELASIASIQMAEKLGAILPDSNLTIAVDVDGNLTVNGAKIIATDIYASNGVIHVIDAVLVPADIAASF
jgi:uncharacterized surface protein with fasciclin (FAS1) repeats